MTNATNTTLDLALTVADATIANQAAELDRLNTLIAALTAPAAEAEEVVITEVEFIETEAAPAPRLVGRLTVYAAASMAAEGIPTQELYVGARGVAQTVRYSDAGGALHLAALDAALYGNNPRYVGDDLTAMWLWVNVKDEAGYQRYKTVNSANVAVNRLAHAGLVNRIGNGAGRRGIGYEIPEAFFQGACTVLRWEDGAITGRRLAVAGAREPKQAEGKNIAEALWDVIKASEARHR